MNICLIRPPILVPLANQTAIPSPPIGLAYVAGALRAVGHQVSVIDGLGMDIDARHLAANDCFLCGATIENVVDAIDPATRLIGVSAAFSFEWPMCRDLINAIRLRFPDAVIMAGGEHVTAMPEFCLEDSALDVAVLGEGEETAVDIAGRLESGGGISRLEGTLGTVMMVAGRPVRSAARKRVTDIDSLALPAWDLLPIANYLDRGLGFGVNRGRSMPMLASRGCPYQCTFCSNPQMWTTRWLARSPEKVIAEMRRYMDLYQVTNFDFYDLTAIVKRDWIVRFCTLLIESGMQITWQLPSGTRSEAMDAEISLLLYRSGCRNLSYAPESGSEAVLTRIKKKIAPARMLESMRGAVRAGLNVKANIIFGFPDETYAEIAASYRFIAGMAWVGVHDLSIWAFSPYPGSELFDQISRQRGLVLDDAYFNSLRGYADNTQAISYSQHIDDRRLRQLRFVGTALFYLLSWLRRPWRPLRMVYNLTRGVQESRGEMALANMARKWGMRLRWSGSSR